MCKKVNFSLKFTLKKTCLLFHSHNFFSPQTRFKRQAAPQLQTRGASADQVPSASQIRPAKSASVVPSKCYLLYAVSKNGFQLFSSTPSSVKTVNTVVIVNKLSQV